MHGCLLRIIGLVAIIGGFFLFTCLFLSWKANTGHHLLDFFEDFADDLLDSEDWAIFAVISLVLACVGIIMFSCSQTYIHAYDEAKTYASLIAEDKSSEEDIVIKIDGVEYVEHVSNEKLETNKRHYIYWRDRREMLAKRKGL